MQLSIRRQKTMKHSTEIPRGIASTTLVGSAATAGNGKDKEKGKPMHNIQSRAKQLLWGLALLLPIVMAGCGGRWDGPKLSAIAVAPANQSIPVAAIQQLTATGVNSDGTSTDITRVAAWSSSNTAVATVDSHGVATGISLGSTTITATSGGKTASVTLNVTAAVLRSVSVTPATPSVVKGLTSQFTALGIYSDGTSQDVTTLAGWLPADTAVATINTSGLATGVAAGPVLISATFAGLTGSATLTVTAASLTSITVTPATASVVKGLTSRFKATGSFNDGSSADITALAAWTSGNTAVATLNADGLATSGLATGVTAGPAVITATLLGKTGSANLTVTAATLLSIAVAPVNLSIVKGLAGPFTATGTFSDNTTLDVTASAVWASADTNVAIMNPNGLATSGLATGVNAGVTGITATYLGKTANATLTVTAATLNAISIAPIGPSIAKGQTNQFIALGTYNNGTSADLTSLVTWASLDTTVATLTPSNNPSSGLATGLKAGTAGITATYQGKTGNATLNVTPINLGLLARFGTFGGTAGMTNTGILTVITGSNGNTADIGTIATTTSSITGFHDSPPSDVYTETPANIGSVTGKIYTCTNSTTGPTLAGANAASCRAATQALLAAQSAYDDLVAMPVGPNPDQGAGQLANLTLVPGVYKAAGGSFRIQGGNLTLDGQGDPNAVFVFQMATTLTVGGPGAAFPQSVLLIGNAQAKNVYWQVGSFATINAGGGGTMVGTIISQAGASFSTAGNVTPVILNGRVVSLGGQVTLVNTLINVPAP
jgi:hypothetical protein